MFLRKRNRRGGAAPSSGVSVIDASPLTPALSPVVGEGIGSHRLKVYPSRVAENLHDVLAGGVASSPSMRKRWLFSATTHSSSVVPRWIYEERNRCGGQIRSGVSWPSLYAA